MTKKVRAWEVRMTLYDAVMAGVVVLGMIWGAWRGITWQLASIASLVVGYMVAQPLSAQLAPRFPGDPVVARALAMLAVYAGVSGGIFLVAWLVRATLRKLKFEAFDRHLGMVLGGLEGALLGIVGTLFVVSLSPQSREPIFQSPSGRLVGHVMSAVGPVLPAEARKVLAPFWSTGQPGALAEAAVAPARTMTQPVPAPKVASSPDSGAIPAYRQELSGLGRSAGQALEQSINSGDTTGLRGLVDEGRTRLGRAAVQALEDQLDRMGGTYDPNARRR